MTFLHTDLFTGSSLSLRQLTQLCVVGPDQLAQVRVTFMSIGCLRIVSLRAHIGMVTQLQTRNPCLQFWPDRDSILRKIPWSRCYFSQWTTLWEVSWESSLTCDEGIGRAKTMMHYCWVTRTNRNVWVTKDCHQLEKSRQAWGSARQSTTGWNVQEGDLAEIQRGKKQQRKDSRWVNHMRSLGPLWRSLSRDCPQIAEWGMTGLNLVYALVKLSDRRQDLEQNSCQGAMQKF